MNSRDSASVGVFAALAYAGSFLLLAIPNATLSLLLVFFSGYMLGRAQGLFVGVVSALLITLFNPYGLPLLPILIAQVFAYAVIGWLGGACQHRLSPRNPWIYRTLLALLGLVTALIYQIPVSLTDAYLFGPFRERLIMSAGFGAVTVIANVLFFVILFPVLAKLKKLGIFHSDRKSDAGHYGRNGS